DHEPWLARVRATVHDPRFAPGGPGDVDLSRGIDLLQIETPKIKSEQGAHVHGFGNPHYWLDPANARPMTRTILEALARRSPDGPFGRERRGGAERRACHHARSLRRRRSGGAGLLAAVRAQRATAHRGAGRRPLRAVAMVEFLWAPFLACLVLTAIHVYLGLHV